MSPAWAQASPRVGCDIYPSCQTPFGDHVAVFSINALIGGVTSGVLRGLRGGSFGQGFAQGLAGGSVVYAGKRIAAQTFGGAGLLGRQVAGVGASIVRNAAEGRSPLERVMLPLGPLHLGLDRASSFRARVSLDMASLAWMTYGFLHPQLQFDLSATLSSGVAVYRTRDRVISVDGIALNGVAGVGTLILGDEALSGVNPDRVLAHERIHVIQMDFVLAAWSEPFEERLLHKLPAGGTLGRYIHPNLGALAVWGIAAALPGLSYERRPWEREAELLAR